MKIRTLQPADLPALMALKTCAGWNQTEADWLRLLRLEPGGCFGVEADGVVVSSATVVNYGNALAWIGMVLTLPAYRGRGCARALMEHAIGYAGERTVRLDASDMGRPLYESLGFVVECRIERWRREPGPAPEVPEVREGPRFDSALDQAVFGADRSALMEDLSREESAWLEGGYAFARPGSEAAFFGPCVSRNADTARGLLRWFTARHAHEATVLDLFPENAQAQEMAAELRYAPARHLTRMVLRPAPVRQPDARYYAAAGFEWG